MQPPNILVVILDAVRARNLHSYGYARRTTPQLDRFAAENVRFARAFAPATWTVPTHTSMLSGLYLSQHRIESVKADRRLNEALVTLPTALRRAGYDTAAFSQNILFSPQHHFEGFGQFFSTDTFNRQRPLSRAALWLAARGGKTADFGRYLRKLLSVRATLDTMQRWIGRRGLDSQPFFVAANLTNVHYEWTPPLDTLLRFAGRRTPLARKRDYFTMNPYGFNSGLLTVTPLHRQMWRDMYDASLAHVDRELGRFLQRLQTSPAWANTIVVITADHGELLGDYENVVGHMLSLSDRLLHVPLIVRHPDVRSCVVEGVVQTHDLYTTALGWAGANTADIPAAQLARPSWDVALNRPNNPTGYAFAEEDYTDSYDVPAGLKNANPAFDPTSVPRRQLSVRSAAYKYVEADGQPARFYDMGIDPDERVNLVGSQLPAYQAAQAAHAATLQQWHDGLTLFAPDAVSSAPETDADVLAQLRALGYIP